MSLEAVTLKPKFINKSVSFLFKLLLMFFVVKTINKIYKYVINNLNTNFSGHGYSKVSDVELRKVPHVE